MLFINKTRVYQYFTKGCVFLMVVASVVMAMPSSELCDIATCPGPLQYYRSLNCTPIYHNEGDCCAIQYNCTAVEMRQKDKCYVNNREYSKDEVLREEDANPCDIGCTCNIGYDGVGAFVCAIVDCFHGPVKSGCYGRNSPTACCPGEEICPEDPGDRPKCVVDGITYLDGENFEVRSDPDLNCVCQPGYQGKNEAPFCSKPNRPYCSPGFREASNIYNYCAPAFYSNQSPRTDCSVFSKCQRSCDKVIRNSDDSNKQLMCRLGNITMQVGDELNVVDCVKCTCEVGPIPTCQRLADDCDSGTTECHETSK